MQKGPGNVSRGPSAADTDCAALSNSVRRGEAPDRWPGQRTPIMFLRIHGDSSAITTATAIDAMPKNRK